MKKLLAGLLLAYLSGSPSLAANVNIDGLPAAGSVGGTDLLECEQGGTNRKCTAAQTAAYVYGLMSADATASGTGAITLATVNSNVGSFGSTTNCVSLTVNAKGLITAASAATCAPAVGSITGLGTGVATQLGNAVSTAGGSTQTIAAGTAALGTSAIASTACATVVTAAATNTATTDTINFTPNADITAVTGYAPVTTGGLAIYPYPTAGNVNFKVCNPTSSSITPGAVTLNWRVTR